VNKYYFDLLNQMLEDMESAPEYYRPTPYWKQLIPTILKDVQEHGFENFRTTASFIELWGNVGHKLETEVHLAIFLTEDSKDKTPHLQQFSESLIGHPTQTLKYNNCIYTNTSLNYLKGLSFLKKNVDTSLIQRVIEIGGGFGCLGEIFLKAKPGAYFYVDVDIPPIAAMATYYLQTVFGKEAILDYIQSRNLQEIDIEQLSKKYRAIVLCPWQLPKLKGKFELGANFISFQEMEPNVVKNYLSYFDAHVSNYVLLRNSRYGKNVAKEPEQMGVIQPIVRQDYLDWLPSFNLIALDSKTFGHDTSMGFESEVMVLSKS